MRAVDLVTVDGRPGSRPELCVEHCARVMPPRFFRQRIVVSPDRVGNLPFTWVPIEPMDRDGYSRFCMKHLWEMGQSPYVLLVQNDGYILRPDLWDPSWLEWDYIGAPWPAGLVGGEERKRVGNGGFSLRSRRLLEFCATLDFEQGVNEDVQICQSRRHLFEAAGLRFAPIEVAQRFSIEWDEPAGPTFGFHGATGRDGREVLS